MVIRQSDLTPPTFTDRHEERLYRKQRLVSSCRAFALLGLDEGVAGHITARDPVETDTFWVNPFGQYFGLISVSDLIRVDHDGEIVEGEGVVNTAGFAIHSRLHMARPDINAAAHSHSIHGKAWSTLGRYLDPISQDSCIFYEDHGLYKGFEGVVLELDEGDRIAAALGSKKAVILQNHGLLTVGETVDEAAFWFVALERACQAQLLAESAGQVKLVDPKTAAETRERIGNPLLGFMSFQPIYRRVVSLYPDMFD